MRGEVVATYTRALAYFAFLQASDSSEPCQWSLIPNTSSVRERSTCLAAYYETTTTARKYATDRISDHTSGTIYVSGCVTATPLFWHNLTDKSRPCYFGKAQSLEPAALRLLSLYGGMPTSYIHNQHSISQAAGGNAMSPCCKNCIACRYDTDVCESATQ